MLALRDGLMVAFRLVPFEAVEHMAYRERLPHELAPTDRLSF